MSDSNRKKPFEQDALGIVLVVVGGFFSVSIVLSLFGEEPSGNHLVSSVTVPVVELVLGLGSVPALVLALGLLVVGALLFLRSDLLPSWRLLGGVALFGVGLSFVFGAIALGGSLGAVFPGLVDRVAGSPVAGRLIGALLGAALTWIGMGLLSALAPRARGSSAEVLQRIGLATRGDGASGVSAAEAALLVTEPRVSAPAPRAPREESVPARRETIRPFPPQAPQPSPQAQPAVKKEVRAAEIAPLKRSVAPVEPRAPAPAVVPASAGATTPITPPTASWEEPVREGTAEAEVEAPVATSASWRAAEETDSDEEETTGETLAEDEESELVAELEEETEDEFDEEDAEDETFEEEEEDEPAAVLAVESIAGNATPAPTWEQIGLFDEEEEEAPAAAPAQVELTPAFDFGPGEPGPSVHEPEPEPAPRAESAEDPFALELAPARAAPVAPVAKVEEPTPRPENPRSEPAQVVLQPRPAAALPSAGPPAPLAAPKPATARAAVAAPAKPVLERVLAPVGEPADESGRWSQLVFDAGCAILEQNRVAVSMLERRFGIDFDQACRVLDELQESGLIGPYMGGRTRDILLTREEWLAHAPHAS